MNEIPDDIRATAAGVFEAMTTPGDKGAQGADFQRDLRLIAEALMAERERERELTIAAIELSIRRERERCAKIADLEQSFCLETADGRTMNLQKSLYAACAATAEGIAQCIRSQPDTSKGTA